MKGQAAFEYMVVAGIALLIITPIFYYAMTYSSDTLVTSQASQAAETIAKAADYVYTLGPSSMTHVWVRMPNSVNETLIVNKTVLIRVFTSGGITDVFANTKSNITGNIPKREGRYKVSLKSTVQGGVVIGNVTFPDMVVGMDKIDTNNIDVFLNNGAGQLNFKTTLSAAGRPRSLLMGDFDNDNDLDVIVGTTDDDLILFTNNGGSWGPVNIDVTATGDVISLAAGDTDGDGDLDIVAGTSNQIINHYRNDGSWTKTTVTSSAGNDVNSLALARMDSGNTLDIVAGLQNRRLQIYSNNGTGGFTLLTTTTTDRAVKVLKTADIDGDGDIDVITGESDNRVRVYTNNGSGTLTEFYQSDNTGGTVNTLDVGNIDGDGDIDVVVGNNDNEVHVFFNDGTGNLGTSTVYSEPTNSVFEVELSDLDNDGDLDVVAGLNRDNTDNFYVYYNDGKGVFGLPIKHSTSSSNNIETMGAGELD